MHEEFPFRLNEEPLHLTKGTAATVRSFDTPEGAHFVDKEVFNTDGFIGDTLEKKAASMRGVFLLLKEHLGEFLPDTHFVVAKGENEKPCIHIAQIHIFGEKFDVLKMSSLKEYEITMSDYNRLKEILFKNVIQDVRFREFLDEPRSVVMEILNDKNLLVDSNKRIKIIDW